MRAKHSTIIAVLAFFILFGLFGGFARAADLPLPSKKLYDQYIRLFKESGAKRGRLHAWQDHGKNRYFLLLSTREIILISSDYVEDGGFRGAPSVALKLSPHGDLREIKLLDSPDTKSYVRLVIRSTDQLEGQNIRNRDDRPVLAVTGATYTAAGFTKTVNGTLDLFLKFYEDMDLGRRGLTYKGDPMPVIYSFD
jgi:hypothetical protein